MTYEEAVVAGIKLVLEHESIKAADAAITLQAFRMGGAGYTGELIQVPLRKFAEMVRQATIEELQSK